jgi:transcriptional regulator NrdR family protein
MVVKKDNRREPFDRKKILKGDKSMREKAVSVEQLEEWWMT